MKTNTIPTIKKAEALEKEADEMKKRSLSSAGPFHKPEYVASKYEEAADIYRKAGNLVKAQELYRQAEIYGYTFSPKDKKRIEEKIRELRVSKAQSLHLGRSLENRFYAIVSIISLIGALFLISFNFTGNSIGNLSRDNLSLLGIGLFALGLIAFVFFKSRKK